jgi:hypothetical protein
MGKDRQGEISKVDVELTSGGRPLMASLTTGKSYDLHLLPPRRWIEIELVDELGRPAAGETYRLEMLDGTIAKEDKLDINGFARVEGFSSEECIISFPLLDLSAWSYLGSSE